MRDFWDAYEENCAIADQTEALIEQSTRKLREENAELSRQRDELLAKLATLRDAIEWQDCPNCNGVIVGGWRCLNCGHDPTAPNETAAIARARSDSGDKP